MVLVNFGDEFLFAGGTVVEEVMIFYIIQYIKIKSISHHPQPLIFIPYLGPEV